MKRLSFKRTSVRRSVYNFNHISVKLSKEEIQYLSDLYANYHKQNIGATKLSIKN